MSLKKTATVEQPHAVFEYERAGFVWRVLKTYKKPAGEAKDPYARWFLATSSPHTHGQPELGDGYAKDIRVHRLTECSREFAEAYPGLVSQHTKVREEA